MAKNCGLSEDVAQSNWKGPKYEEIGFRGRIGDLDKFFRGKKGEGQSEVEGSFEVVQGEFKGF